MPKVTRKGWGAALPWKLDLFRSIVRAAVQCRWPAGDRQDAQRDRRRALTYRDAARIAADEGWSGSRFTPALRSRCTPDRPTGRRSGTWSRTCIRCRCNGQRGHLDRPGCCRDDAGDRLRRRGHRTGMPGTAPGCSVSWRTDSATGRRYRPHGGAGVRVLREHAGLLVETSVSSQGARRSASTSPGTSRLRGASASAPGWRMWSTLAELDDLLEMVA